MNLRKTCRTGGGVFAWNLRRPGGAFFGGGVQLKDVSKSANATGTRAVGCVPKP